MKTLHIFSLFCLLFFNCSGQDKSKTNKENNIKPDETITVNKEYDEFGNLKRYDSIYSYSYTSKGKMNDSLMLKFQKYFNNHSFFNDSFFDEFFGKDSLTGGFYPDNFFHQGFMDNNQHIQDMMKRMDSIQQLFFNDKYQMIIPPEPEENKETKFMKQI